MIFDFVLKMICLCINYPSLSQVTKPLVRRLGRVPTPWRLLTICSLLLHLVLLPGSDWFDAWPVRTSGESGPMGKLCPGHAAGQTAFRHWQRGVWFGMETGDFSCNLIHYWFCFFCMDLKHVNSIVFCFTCQVGHSSASLWFLLEEGKVCLCRVGH